MSEKLLKVKSLLDEFKDKHGNIVIPEKSLINVEGAGGGAMIINPIPGCCGQDTKSDGCMSSPSGPRC